MTEIPLPGQLPDILMKNPPHRIFAYIHSRPAGQVMGVAIDGRSGKVIEAVILPNKQRVMLGLGIGDERAHAHHKYRRRFPKGYRLLWTDNPETDERLDAVKGRLELSAKEFRDTGTHITTSEAKRSDPHKQEGVGALSPVGDLLLSLCKHELHMQQASSKQPSNQWCQPPGQLLIEIRDKINRNLFTEDSSDETHSN